jgi:hypothetical protein
VVFQNKFLLDAAAEQSFDFSINRFYKLIITLYYF